MNPAVMLRVICQVHHTVLKSELRIQMSGNDHEVIRLPVMVQRRPS